MHVAGVERSVSSLRDRGAWCFCWGHGVQGGSLLTPLGHTAWSCLGHVGVSTLGEGTDRGMYTRTHGLTLRHPPQDRCTRVPRRENAHALACSPLHPPPLQAVTWGWGLSLWWSFPHVNIGVRGKWNCGHVISWAVTIAHRLNTGPSSLFK